MLKKIILLMCSLYSLPSVQAGTIGDYNNLASSGMVFIAVEGGWSWNKWQGFRANIADVGTILTSKHTQKGSARISAGAQKKLRPYFSVLGEIGYGYYGKTDINFHQHGPQLSIASGAADFSQIKVKATLDGLDVLAGVSYRISQFDLSFKAGAMIQNARYKPSINLSNYDRGNSYGSAYWDTSTTQVLPEIKLGMGYQLIENLYINAAWTHVFGQKPGINYTTDANNSGGFLAIKSQNPTLDAITIGASYALPI